jgi:8-oxo-dGTP diphosphatase
MAASVEMIDVVDENGVPSGRAKPRSSIHRDGDWHRTVHVWLANGRGEVLFQKRSSAKESFPGVWDVSAAGHIESGETSAAAAIKELREELGIDVRPGDLRLLFSVKSALTHGSGSFIDNEISDVYVVWLDIDKNDFHLQASEVSDVRFVEVARLARLAQGAETRDTAFAPHEREYRRLYDYFCAEKKRLPDR